MNRRTDATETGKVYCPICTHTVEAEILPVGRDSVRAVRKPIVKPGQKCPRCAGSLDAGYIFAVSRAA